MKKWLAGAAVCAGLMSIPQTINETEASNKLYFPRVRTEEIINKTKHDVLFTIDDGPTKNTLEIAQTLDSLQYEGIFFVIGKHITETTRKELIEVVKMGQKLGNHAYSHKNFQTLTIDQAKQQIIETDGFITSIYKDAGIIQDKKYIRYPFGVEPPKYYRDEFDQFLDSLGYEPAMYRRMDTDLKDRRRQPSDQKIEKMKSGDTILLHEKSWTVETIKSIVVSLDEKTNTLISHQ